MLPDVASPETSYPYVDKPLIEARHTLVHQRGPMVPQKRYKPNTSSERRRYVDEVNLEPAIFFFMQNPDESGIPLRDALHGRFARLVGRDEPMFRECGPSISVRINVSVTPHSFSVSGTFQCTNT